MVHCVFNVFLLFSSYFAEWPWVQAVGLVECSRVHALAEAAHSNMSLVVEAKLDSRFCPRGAWGCTRTGLHVWRSCSSCSSDSMVATCLPCGRLRRELQVKQQVQRSSKKRNVSWWERSQGTWSLCICEFGNIHRKFDEFAVRPGRFLHSKPLLGFSSPSEPQQSWGPLTSFES